MNEEKLCIDARKRLTMTGVEQVDGYSESALKLTVNRTKVTIRGNGLKITAFNKATGNLSCDGDIAEVSYGGKKTPFLKRLFK